MSTNPIWEKFQHAAVSLAGSGPIKDRLTQAYRDHLSEVAEEDLPKELRSEFRALNRALTRESPLLRGEDAFRATIRKLSNEEAGELACAVVQMFAALPRSTAVPQRARSSAQIVPLYIAEA
jgi:hypothetical protein